MPFYPHGSSDQKESREDRQIGSVEDFPQEGRPLIRLCFWDGGAVSSFNRSGTPAILGERETRQSVADNKPGYALVWSDQHSVLRGGWERGKKGMKWPPKPRSPRGI